MYSVGPVNLYEQGTSTPSPTPRLVCGPVIVQVTTVAQEVIYIPAYTLGQMSNNFFMARANTSFLFPSSFLTANSSPM